jgi:Domain of unknown function (DUF932)
MTSNARRNTPLSNEQLRQIAPSIFATQPWQRMSDRYAFIPTIEIVDAMRVEGFVPVHAAQSKTRIEGKQDFTKHVIRFRDFRTGDAPAIRSLGQIYPELVLTNAHDGGSAYKIDAGLFRLVCLNGMTVQSGNLSQINVRHTGSPAGIIDASYQLVSEFPKVLESVERFAALRLEAPQREAYATAALALRYDDPQTAPVSAQQILRPKRDEDATPTLWNTLNTVQEHVIRGGLRGRNPQTLRRVSTRPVSGISEDARLNKALWVLTERMAALAA